MNDDIVDCYKIFSVRVVSLGICGAFIGDNSRTQVMITDDDGKLK